MHLGGLEELQLQELQSISLAKMEGLSFFLSELESLVAQVPLKLAFVVEAGLKLFLTLLLSHRKFWDHKHMPSMPRAS